VRTIVQYFDLITSIAERSGAASVEIEFDQVDATTGVVDGVFYFYDGSRLEFTERVSIQNRHPIKTVYRYQYVGAENAIFRYDNAAHHPDLPNFPHHKHVGKERLPAIEPTFKQVLDEIASVLGATTPPSIPKRRRRTKR
jgi:hypothetical protein